MDVILSAAISAVLSLIICRIIPEDRYLRCFSMLKMFCKEESNCSNYITSPSVVLASIRMEVFLIQKYIQSCTCNLPQRSPIDYQFITSFPPPFPDPVLPAGQENNMSCLFKRHIMSRKEARALHHGWCLQTELILKGQLEGPALKFAFLVRIRI